MPRMFDDPFTHKSAPRQPGGWPVVMRWCVLAVLLCANSQAAAQPHLLPDMHHTAWSPQQGAPADIWELAQAPDGHLWLGTGFGVYRFDGVAFTPVVLAPGHALRSPNITALTHMPDGSTWVGHVGGVSVIQGNQIRHFGEEQGLAGAHVKLIAQDDQGRTWAATTIGLLYLDADQWHRAGADMGFVGSRGEWVMQDAGGTLWVASDRTVVYRPRGGTSFLPTGIASTAFALLTEASDGTIWMSDERHGIRRIARPRADGSPQIEVVPARGLEKTSAYRLLVRRDGSVWGTERRRGGLFRAKPVADGSYRLEHLTKADGLPSNRAVPLIEDREGNVWLGSDHGLSRFRQRDVFMLPHAEGNISGNYTLFEPKDGNVLVITQAEQLPANRALRDRMAAGERPGSVLIPGLPSIVSTYGLWTLKDGRRRKVAPPSGLDWIKHYNCGTLDGAGTPWLSFTEGIYRYEGERWVQVPQLDGAWSMVRGADGAIWMGYRYDRVVRWKDGVPRRFGPEDGLAVGSVETMLAVGDEVVVAGEKGVAVLHAGRFHTLGGDRHPVLLGVSGMAADEKGELWLNGNRGIVRTTFDALRRAATNPGHVLAHRLFDAQDGLDGIALQGVSGPTAARGTDGLLWFATNQGIAVIDPKAVAHNTVAPQVQVRALVVGDATLPAAAPLELPSRTSNLQINYTATSLTAPDRMRFRYRLDGVDSDWRDAGTRREAYYTNLGPGDYVFRVMAANNDGVWSTQEAVLPFAIRPTFWQTSWFALLCALFAGLLLYMFYLLRLRIVSARMRARLEERHVERERIARELHDTLLQGFQGLILRTDALIGQLRDGDPLKHAMTQTVDRAQAALIEGRDSVLGLRALSQQTGSLANALTAVGAEFASSWPVAVEVRVDGKPRELQPLVGDELYRVGREAMVNALRHASPNRVTVALRFGREEFELEVCDDGCGIDAQVLESGARPGHFGLAGMRERIAGLGGRMSMWSAPGRGTRIVVQLPAKVAYDGQLLR